MDETQVLPDVYLNETYVEAAQLPRYDGEETPQADLYCEGVPPLPLMFGRNVIARSRGDAADAEALAAWREESAQNGLSTAVYGCFLPRQALSLQHAAVVIQRGFYILEDLGSTNGSKLMDRGSGETMPVAHQQRTTFDPANTRIVLADVELEVRPRAAPRLASSPVYVPAAAGGTTPFMGMPDSQRSLADEEPAPAVLFPPPPPMFAEPAAAGGLALRTPLATLPPPDAAGSPSAGFTAGLTQVLPARAAPGTMLVGGPRGASPLGGDTVRLSFGDVAVAPPSAPPSATASRLGLALHSPTFGNTIAGGRSPLMTGREGGGPFGAPAAQPAFGSAAWANEGQLRSSQQADMVAPAFAGATLLPDFSPPAAEEAGATLVLDFGHLGPEATLGGATLPAGGADTQLQAGADTQVPADDDDAPMAVDEPAGATLQLTGGEAAAAPGDDAAPMAPDYVSSLPDFFMRSAPQEPEAVAEPEPQPEAEVVAAPEAAAPASLRSADDAVVAQPAAAPPSQPREASAPLVAVEAVVEPPVAEAEPVADEAPAPLPVEPAPVAEEEAQPEAEEAAPVPAPAPAPAASEDSDVTVDEPGDAPVSSAPAAVASARALPLSPLPEEAAAPAAPPAAGRQSGESPAGNSGRPSQLADALFGPGMSSLPDSQNNPQFAAAAAAAMQQPAPVVAPAPPAAAPADSEDSDITVDEPSPVVAAGTAPAEPDAVDSAAPAAGLPAASQPGDGAAGASEAVAPLHLTYETMAPPAARPASPPPEDSFDGGSPDMEARGLFETQFPVDAQQVAGAWRDIGGFIPPSDPLAPSDAAPVPAPAPVAVAPVVAPSPSPPPRAAQEMPPPPPRFPAGSPAVIRDAAARSPAAARPYGGVGETQGNELPAFAHFVGAANALVPPSPDDDAGAGAAPARAAKPTAAEARKAAAAAKKREKAAAAAAEAEAEPEPAKAPASAARGGRKGRAAAAELAAVEEEEPAAAAPPPPPVSAAKGAKPGPTPRRSAKKDAAPPSPPAAAEEEAAEAAAPPPQSTRRGRGAKAAAAAAPEAAAAEDGVHGTQELAAAAVPPVEVEGTQELAPAPAGRGGRKSAAAALPAAAAKESPPAGGRAKRGRKQPAEEPAEEPAAAAAAPAPPTGVGRGSKRAKVSAAAEPAEPAEPEAPAAELEAEPEAAPAPPAARGGRGKKTASPAKKAAEPEAAPAPAAKPAGRGQKRAAAASVDAPAEPAAVAAEEDGSAKRRRGGSDGGDVRVLMSSSLPAAEARKLRDKLSRLARVTVLDDKDESLGFTHFLMSSSAGGFKRTRNALAALATGRPIVAPSWVEACVAAGTVVDASAHLLQDTKAEREFKFTMQGSFDAARRVKVLDGEVVYILPGAKANDAMAAMLRDVVPLAGARLAEAFGDDVTLAVGAPGFRDAERRRVVAAGKTVHTPEVILSALVCQRLDKSAHAA